MANEQIYQQTEVTTLNDADVAAFDVDVSGTFRTRKITKANLKKALGVIPTQDTTLETTVLVLDKIVGGYYTGTSGAAKSATTYTTSGTNLGAFVQVLINTTSEPTVTGGTKISGADWVTGTNMYMVVTYNGTRVEYFFLEI